jgi:hypothetical protein
MYSLRVMLERHRKRKRNGADQVAEVDLSTRFGPGGRDPQEYGRRGGQRSAEVRAALARLDPDAIARQLARNSSSPLAQRSALLYAQRRESEADRERRLADDVVLGLLDAKELVEREIVQEEERRDALRAEVDELEQRRRQLESRDGVVAVLEQIGEERATAAAAQLGWGDDGEDDGDVAA